MIWKITFLFVLVAMMSAGSYLHEKYDEQNKTIDIYNYTKQVQFNESHFSFNLTIDNKQPTERVDKVLTDTFNWFGSTFYNMALWSFEWGYVNYKVYNFGLMVQFLKWVLILWLIFTIFPVIAPLLALLYLCYLGIKKLIG